LGQKRGTEETAVNPYGFLTGRRREALCERGNRVMRLQGEQGCPIEEFLGMLGNAWQCEILTVLSAL
jgi:hypothetical protein